VWRPTSMPSADAFRYPNPSILSPVAIDTSSLNFQVEQSHTSDAQFRCGAFTSSKPGKRPPQRKRSQHLCALTQNGGYQPVYAARF
jgi:hypothetical protein